MPADISIGRLRGGLCAYWIGADGKRTRHQLAARTRKEAEAEAIDLYRRLTIATTGQTVTELWAGYLRDRADRPIATTMNSTGKAVLRHFGALRPDQISRADCLSYADTRRGAGIQDGSIWTELGHLRTVLQWAVKARLINHAPEIPRPSKPAPKERALSRAEIDQLLAARAEPHIRLAIILMLSTAARIGAILDLTWDRVDLDRGQINLRRDSTGPRKGRATVPINAGLRAALIQAQAAALSDSVVEFAAGPVQSIRRGFQAAVSRAGLADVTPHVLRHTAAVHMAEAGVPIGEISQYLGHSNSSITERVYARYSPTHLQKAAQVLDFVKIRGVKRLR